MNENQDVSKGPQMARIAYADWFAGFPEVDGYYFRPTPGGVVIVEVFHQDGKRFVARLGRPYLDPVDSIISGLWSGPIPIPSAPDSSKTVRIPNGDVVREDTSKPDARKC